MNEAVTWITASMGLVYDWIEEINDGERGLNKITCDST